MKKMGEKKVEVAREVKLQAKKAFLFNSEAMHCTMFKASKKHQAFFPPRRRNIFIQTLPTS